MSEQVPSIGRIVHVVDSFRNEHHAAIITDVSENSTRIVYTAFAPFRERHGFSSYSETMEVGTWHWPERTV